VVRVLGLGIIWVRVAYPVRADPLHEVPVIAPMLWPFAHVMVGWVVDTAMIAFAIIL